MVRVPEGRATLGLRRSDSNVFGWDNEFEQHSVDVPAFSMDRYKVTNGEFLEFMKASGYEKPSYWSKKDWEWRASAGVRHPGFWVKGEDGWHLRTMFSEIPLPLEWPVYVSHAEASAYARWAGRSLPSEAQWQRAAYGTQTGKERQYPWGDEPPSAGHGNFDFARWDPVSVAAHPEGTSAFGVSDLIGNGWEWTSTPFGPFPGFEPFPFYRGYSADFFDHKHFVMKGGSPRTAACMLRRSFRNWFQSHYPYVYAGFRCVSH
jgi:ergothioneine biosynthesis protein EgtB